MKWVEKIVNIKKRRKKNKSIVKRESLILEEIRKN